MPEDIQQKTEERKTLVDLSNEYERTVSELVALNEEPDENSAEWLTRLNAVSELLCQKVDAYGVVEAKLEARAGFWEHQKQACAVAQRVCENAKKSLRERLKYVLSATEGKSLQGDLYRYFLSKAAVKIDIDEAKLPNSFKRIKTEMVPDREAIETAVAKGELIPGVTVNRENYSLRKGTPK